MMIFYLINIYLIKKQRFDKKMGKRARKWGTLSDWWELFRTFAYTASIIPMLIAAVMLNEKDLLNLPLFFLLFFGVLGVHTGANIVNEYFDFKIGPDTLDANIASTVIMEERIEPELALDMARLFFLHFLFFSVIFAYFLQQPGIFLYALLGVLGGYFYTAPPLYFKYRGLGAISIFILFGYLLPQAVYYTFSGEIIFTILFLPHSFLVTAIVFANNLGDDYIVVEQCQRQRGFLIYLLLILAAYFMVILAAFQQKVSWLPIIILITVTSFWAVRDLGQAFGGIADPEKFEKLDHRTAFLHFIFGFGWIICLLWTVN